MENKHVVVVVVVGGGFIKFSLIKQITSKECDVICNIQKQY